MHPILLHVGSFELHSYGAFGALGFLVGAFFGLRFTDREGIDRDAMIDVIFWSSIAAIVGARALFILQNPDVFPSPSAWFNLRTGGMVFYGAPLLGLPVLVGLLWRHQLPAWRVLDGFGIWLPLAHAFSRVGCVLAGCCFGRPTDLPWAVTYDHPRSLGPLDVAVHPVQLYEAAGLVLISTIAARLDPKRRFDGQTFLTWVGGYAVLRFFTETLRGDPDRGTIGPLSTSQAISVAALVLVAALVAWRRRAAA